MSFFSLSASLVHDHSRVMDRKTIRSSFQTRWRWFRWIGRYFWKTCQELCQLTLLRSMYFLCQRGLKSRTYFLQLQKFQESSVTKSVFFLQLTQRIFIPTFLHAFVTPRTDYCNVLYFGTTLKDHLDASTSAEHYELNYTTLHFLFASWCNSSC